MQYRELGRSGVVVSEVGLGGNRLGQEYASDEFWRGLILRAVELGVTVFDSAEAYGWGRSEEMLGLALGNRDDVVVATKMCRVKETGVKEYTAERMMVTAEGSLRRLRRDVIDVIRHASQNRVAHRLRRIAARVAVPVQLLDPFPIIIHAESLEKITSGYLTGKILGKFDQLGRRLFQNFEYCVLGDLYSFNNLTQLVSMVHIEAHGVFHTRPPRQQFLYRRHTDGGQGRRQTMRSPQLVDPIES